MSPCSHESGKEKDKDKGGLSEYSWTINRLVSIYFKTIMNTADCGWVFLVGWEVQPSGSSRAVFYLEESDCVLWNKIINKTIWSMECLGWEPSAMPDTCMWIFHVQPQSEQQRTFIFAYTSVLFFSIQGLFQEAILVEAFLLTLTWEETEFSVSESEVTETSSQLSSLLTLWT